MEPLTELASAIVAIQLELRNPPLDATNPHFRNRYPSLAGCRDAIVPVAAKHGVAILQNLVTNEQGVGCETILMHKSGQSMRFGPLYLPASKHDPQGFGSCATYARRYSLLAAFNVVGDEDDDANKGTEAHRAAPLARSSRPASGPSPQSVADRFMKAWEVGLDEAVLEVHTDIQADQELYSAAWKLIPAGTRKSIKECIARAKGGNGATLA